MAILVGGSVSCERGTLVPHAGINPVCPLVSHLRQASNRALAHQRPGAKSTSCARIHLCARISTSARLLLPPVSLTCPLPARYPEKYAVSLPLSLSLSLSLCLYVCLYRSLSPALSLSLSCARALALSFSLYLRRSWTPCSLSMSSPHNHQI